MSYKNPQDLEGISLDDVLGGLIPGESGRTEFAVQGAKERIAVVYGPKYPVAVVYSPKDRDFICFEPMSGPTNAFNLKQAGKYNDLQTIRREANGRKASGFIPPASETGTWNNVSRREVCYDQDSCRGGCRRLCCLPVARITAALRIRHEAS